MYRDLEREVVIAQGWMNLSHIKLCTPLGYCGSTIFSQDNFLILLFWVLATLVLSEKMKVFHLTKKEKDDLNLKLT